MNQTFCCTALLFPESELQSNIVVKVYSFVDWLTFNRKILLIRLATVVLCWRLFTSFAIKMPELKIRNHAPSNQPILYLATFPLDIQNTTGELQQKHWHKNTGRHYHFRFIVSFTHII